MKYSSVVLSIILHVTFFTKGELLAKESNKLTKLKRESVKSVKNIEFDHKNIREKYEPSTMFTGNDEDEFTSKVITRRSNQTNHKMMTSEVNKGIYQSVTTSIVKNGYYTSGLAKMHSNKLTKLEEDSKKLEKMEADIEELQKEIELMDEL